LRFATLCDRRLSASFLSRSYVSRDAVPASALLLKARFRFLGG
jgi:hypothetical protein